MQGINREIEKQIKRDISERLNTSSGSYYGNNK